LILAVGAISALCIYGFYGHSKNASVPEVGVAGIAGVAGIDGGTATSGVAKMTPASKEFTEVKELHRDFITKFDKNVADRKGEGLKKNQTLAYETLILLKAKQNEVFEPGAQKYLDDFTNLVQQYYDQVVRYNSESIYLSEVNNKSRSEVERIRKDSSLSQEEKASRISHIVKDDDSEFQRATISANDLDGTVKSIRNLSDSGTEQQQSLLN